jgi:hypothetical protein
MNVAARRVKAHTVSINVNERKKWACNSQVREGPKNRDCHEIVTVNRAKWAKTSKAQGTEIRSI